MMIFRRENEGKNGILIMKVKFEEELEEKCGICWK